MFQVLLGTKSRAFGLSRTVDRRMLASFFGGAATLMMAGSTKIDFMLECLIIVGYRGSGDNKLRLKSRAFLEFGAP